MEPPWLTVPTNNKRKKSALSPSPTQSSPDQASSSKKLKLNEISNVDEIMTEDGFEKVLTKEEKRKMKKESAKAAQKAKKPPTLNYATAGFKNGKHITIASVRDLIEFLVTGTIPEPNWMKVENRNSVEHVVTLYIPGLLPSHLGLSPTTLKPSQLLPFPLAAPTDDPKIPHMSKLFSNALPTKAPGDQYRFHPALNTLLSTVVPQKEKERRNKEKQKLFKKRMEDAANSRKEGTADQKETEEVEAGAGSSSFDPVLFLLTPNQMIENEYPIPSYFPLSVEGFMKGSPEDVQKGNEVFLPWTGVEQEAEQAKKKELPTGWRETERAAEGSKDGRFPVLAVDCEMCMTTVGDELTRVTAIDHATGKVVYDELVIPEGTVTDYKTQWSGITEEILSKATLTLPEVQSALLSRSDLITPHTILLGHSLENDLLALKIRHPLVVDTALLFPHAKGRPSKPSLRWLTGKWLGREIQNRGAAGHDSAEDAMACLELLKRKCSEGPEFGETMEDMETLFERFSRHASNSTSPGRTSLLCDYGNSTGRMRATRAFVCRNDDEVVNNLTENVEDFDFTFARMFDLSNAQKWTTPRPTDSKPLGVVEPEALSLIDIDTDDPNETDQALARLNERLIQIHDALPPRTVFIILTGNGDPRPVISMNARRKAFEFKYKKLGESGAQQLPDDEKWTTQDERDLADAVLNARMGMAFFCVKNVAPPAK